MQIVVAYAEANNQAWLELEVPDDCCVHDAIERSGVLKRFPALDLTKSKVGVYGKLVKLEAPLQPGDRVEIYRAILVDPKLVPRRKMADDDDDDD
ncbi:RnfH family protein [Pseudomonas sp.]|jgi:putative ubiquitin-RnfH superfamily antitoxin RatB of RatAB toxin-antitoxin module|uniref:RnfH family protein n=1 Tax=Pseudomonas sp. TaxID=306 RepID=UPI0028AC341A|nr:RnfH family protein [Pseudomonas sp.]